MVSGISCGGSNAFSNLEEIRERYKTAKQARKDAKAANMDSVKARDEKAKTADNAWSDRSDASYKSEQSHISLDSAQEANKIDSLLQALQSKTKAIANMK